MTQWITSSSLLIVAVLLIRKIAGDRLSARVRYALWGLVLLRLLIPVSIGESALSVQNWLPEEQTAVTQRLPMDASSDSEEILHTTQPPLQTVAPAEREVQVEILPIVYVIGCVAVGGVLLLSNLRFALRLRRSRRFIMRKSLPVYETTAVETPCMFGLLCPAVYLTADVMADKAAQQHVLAHELTHYRHGDHIWSFLRCVAVTLHWYNPLVWVAAFASQQDAELACDEGALRSLGDGERTAYARTLVDMTCVSYRDALTIATSITGGKCDLKRRVVRIAKNPKMTVTALIVVLVAAALAAVMLFTGASTPAIEGVWRMEISALGVGADGNSDAYMEYEFYDGKGIRTDHINGVLRSAEAFTYTLGEQTISLLFETADEPTNYNWECEGDTLTLSAKRGEMVLTRTEREEVPYLPEGYVEIISLVLTRPDESLSAELTAVQQAQLLELLRSGATGETRKEQLDAEPFKISVCTSENAFSIANGLVYTDSSEKGYVLSNAEEIEEWLSAVNWEGERSLADLMLQGFVPADMADIVDAELILYNRSFKADPARLAFLEELLTTAEDSFASKCPFEGYLVVTLSDGRQLAVTPALDSCAAFRIGDAYYEYGNQFENPADDASYDNSELLAIFGLDADTIMGLWEEVRQQQQQGEAIGGLNDQGDVIRVLDDVMTPTRLSDSTKELIIALLAEGMGKAIGEEAVAFDSLYYTVLFETLGAAEGFVTLSDNGSLYMDGVRYELTTADELLALLAEHYSTMRITKDGYEISELTGVVGEFLYPELMGVPDGVAVTWICADETVCTVQGDAYGAEIYVTGVGETVVTVEYSDGAAYSDCVVIYGAEP